MAKVNLSNTLGVEHLPAPKKEMMVLEELPSPDSIDEDEDYKLVRTTLQKLIKKGSDALDEISDIARQNESARGYEVFANLIKTVGETSKDLYSLQKSKKDLRGGDKPSKLDETTISVDKAVFVGTTADLLRSIKEEK